MRRPDFVLPGERGEKDYLHRWWLIPRNRWLNAYLHRFYSSDAPVCHDHPWFNVSIILKGSYREHFHDGTSKIRKPGHVVLRSAKALHWLEVIEPVTTLFLTGPRARQWGFMTPGGWVHHADYKGASHD